jgi:hypothetical protein
MRLGCWLIDLADSLKKAFRHMGVCGIEGLSGNAIFS